MNYSIVYHVRSWVKKINKSNVLQEDPTPDSDFIKDKLYKNKNIILAAAVESKKYLLKK